MTETTSPEAGHSPEHMAHLRQEAYTMGLYVAICLLAGLIALPVSDAEHTNTLGVIWGVTLGLALAHWFAFRVSSRLVGAGRVRPQDVQSAVAQLAGAAVVGVLTSLAVLLAPNEAESLVAALVLAGFIALVGYAVARGGGASQVRALTYATIVVVVAVAIALIKNLLAGH